MALLLSGADTEGCTTMDGGTSSPRVWKDGRLQDPAGDAALASLCQAVERAVRAHQGAATPVRAVILVFDQPAARAEAAEPTAAPVPVYVDVFDSGYGHEAGYGHGI
jgi:hypothetical protein